MPLAVTSLPYNEASHSFGFHYSELKYFDLLVADCFRDPANGITSRTTIPKGMSFYLAWRVGGSGNAQPEYTAANIVTDAASGAIAGRVGTDPGAADGPWAGATNTIAPELYPCNEIMPSLSGIYHGGGGGTPPLTANNCKLQSPGYYNTESQSAGGWQADSLIRFHADPWYWNIYTNPIALPYIDTALSSELHGGYGAIILSAGGDDGSGGTLGPDPATLSPAQDSFKYTDYCHLNWDLQQPVEAAEYQILRPSSTNLGALLAVGSPKAIGPTFWDPIFGKGVAGSRFLAMTRFQDRLVLSGGIEPSKIAFSSSDSIHEPRFVPFGYAGDIGGPTNAFTATLDRLETTVTNIFSIENDLFVGTDNRLWKVYSTDALQNLHAGQIFQQPISMTGTANIQAALSEDVAMYVSANLKHIHRLTFGGDDEGYRLDEISIYSAHLFETGIRRITSQVAPENLLWIIDSVGEFFSYSLNRRELVQGASRHYVGGNSSGSRMLDIAAYSSPHYPGQQRLAAMVRRTSAAGVPTVSIETIEQDYDLSANTTAWNYLDKYRTYRLPSPVTAIPAATLDPYSGETVTIVFEGVEYMGTTVDADGGIASPPWTEPGSTLTIGFPYESRLETLPFDLSLSTRDGGGGQTDMSLRRVFEVVAKVHNSKGGTAGALGTPGEYLVYPSEGALATTKDINLPIDGESDTTGGIFISTNTSERLEIAQLILRTDYQMRGGNE